MSWQEELRRLDAQLAAGVITQDQHTRQRDDILAEASGQPAASDGSTPDDGGTPDDTASDGPKWEAANPAAAAQLPDGSDATNVQPNVPSPTADRPSTKPAPTPLGYAPSTAPRQPSPLFVPQTPASAGRPGAAQPAAFAPASSSYGQGAFAAQGPEQRPDQQSADYPDFSPPPNRGRGRTWLAVTLAVLVALGAVIGGAWWLGQDSGTSAAPPSSESPSDGSGSGAGSTDDTALEDRLPELPGTPSPDNSTMSISRGLDLGFITAADAESMRRFGVADLVYRASADGDDGYSLVVARTPSAQKAGGLGEALNSSLVKEGFANDRLRDDPRFIAFTGEQDAGRVSIVWYSSDNATIGIGASQPKSGDESELLERLEQVLVSLDEELPAN